MPKKFTFGDEGVAATPPPTVERRRKVFDFPAPVEETPAPVVAERKPRTLNFPVNPEPVAAPEPARRPKMIAPTGSGEAVNQRRVRDRTTTDILVDEAVKQSPDISVGRVRGRIDMLLRADNQELMSWGELNLAPLQAASGVQSEIANELSRINAVGALTEARDATQRPQTLFDRMSGKSPDAYAASLTKAKAALYALMAKSETQLREFKPEVVDLHLDGIALAVTLNEYRDPVMMNIANSRLKTLLLAHQTGTMLVTVLETTVQQCAAFINQIDSMVSVSIPQWKLSHQK